MRSTAKFLICHPVKNNKKIQNLSYSINEPTDIEREEKDFISEGNGQAAILKSINNGEQYKALL